MEHCSGKDTSLDKTQFLSPKSLSSSRTIRSIEMYNTQCSDHRILGLNLEKDVGDHFVQPPRCTGKETQHRDPSDLPLIIQVENSWASIESWFSESKAAAQRWWFERCKRQSTVSERWRTGLVDQERVCGHGRLNVNSTGKEGEIGIRNHLSRRSLKTGCYLQAEHGPIWPKLRLPIGESKTIQNLRYMVLDCVEPSGPRRRCWTWPRSSRNH